MESSARNGSFSARNDHKHQTDKGGADFHPVGSSGAKMLSFEKMSASVLIVPEDITPKKLFYMQMQELEAMYHLEKKRASAHSQLE